MSGGTASTGANSTSVSTGVINSSATGGNNAAGNGSGSNGSSAATPVASAGAASSTNTGVNTNTGSSSVQPTAVNSTQTAASTSVPTMTEDQKLAQRQWQFCVQLAKYLYEVSGTVASKLSKIWLPDKCCSHQKDAGCYFVVPCCRPCLHLAHKIRLNIPIHLHGIMLGYLSTGQLCLTCHMFGTYRPNKT